MSSRFYEEGPMSRMYFQRLENCARCGGTHEHVALLPLAQVIDPDYECDRVACKHSHPTWTHWAPCPTNGQPILGRYLP